MIRVTALLVVAVIGLPVAWVAGLSFGISLSGGVEGMAAFRSFTGSLGDWISGLGALSASCVAVYLADRARQENAPKVEINQYCTADVLSLDMVSVGEKPAIISGVFVRSQKRRKQVMLSRPPFVQPEDMPWVLNYGDKKRLNFPKVSWDRILREIRSELDEEKLDDLLVVVGLTTTRFTQLIDPKFSSALSELESKTGKT